jgi:hypothetical protein
MHHVLINVAFILVAPIAIGVLKVANFLLAKLASLYRNYP